MKKKTKFIYLVRVYFLDMSDVERRIQRERTWGFYSSKKVARRCILENWTDIFEAEYYNFAVIMKMPEGVCILPRENEWYENNNGKISLIDYDPINLNRGKTSFKYSIGW